jgi:hypothetical protein
MTLTPLARPGAGLLAQFLTTCPSCGQAAAAHVDTQGEATLVRFVCPDGCAVDAAVVLAALPTGGPAASPVEVPA